MCAGEHRGRRVGKSPPSWINAPQRTRLTAFGDGWEYFSLRNRVLCLAVQTSRESFLTQLEDVEMSSRRLRAIAFACGAAAALSVGSAFATETVAAKPQASIPFVNHGGIWDWRADGDKGLWVQSNNRQWYYAKFMGPCLGLDFANSVGFDARPMGTFDRFSAVVVPRWGRCQVQSLELSDGPPSKKANG